MAFFVFLFDMVFSIIGEKGEEGIMFFKKKVTFGLTKHVGEFQLRSQNEEISDCKKEDICLFLERMFKEWDEFVVLTPPQSIERVQFIQAAQASNGIRVELGIEKNGRCELFYKIYSCDDCLVVFLDFYCEGKIPALQDYQPVKF